MKSFVRAQQGAMLLEALIAILIFSMGILAIVGLQAASVRLSGDARYRTDANMLVNKIIAQMWVDNHTPSYLQSKYDSSSAASSVVFTAWASDVQAALPGADQNLPTISVVPTPGVNPNAPSTMVTVTVFWNLPGEPAANRHSATAVAQIR
jgi:type IV pilus assembly protein PilV